MLLEYIPDQFRVLFTVRVCKAYLWVAGVDVKVVPVTAVEFERPAPRQYYSVLENRNWIDNGFEPLRNYKLAIKEYIELIKWIKKYVFIIPLVIALVSITAVSVGFLDFLGLGNNHGDVNVVEDGEYCTVDEVSAYIKEFNKLPSNYITKKKLKA